MKAMLIFVLLGWDAPAATDVNDAIRWTRAMIRGEADYSDSLRAFADALPVERHYSVRLEDDSSVPMTIRYGWVRHEILAALQAWPRDRSGLERLLRNVSSYHPALPETVAPADSMRYRAMADDILQRREFRQVDKENRIAQWFRDRLREFFRWLSKFLPEPKPMDVRVPLEMTGVGQVVYYLLLAVGGLLLIYVIVQIVRRVRRKEREEEKPDLPLLEEGETIEPDEQWTLATTEADRGNYRRAIRHVLLSVLLHLDKNDYVRFRRDYTNFEYADWIAHADRLLEGSEMAAQFRSLAMIFDRVWYGMKEAREQDFRRSAEVRQSILAKAPVHE